jgi:hypothetical protein
MAWSAAAVSMFAAAAPATVPLSAGLGAASIVSFAGHRRFRPVAASYSTGIRTPIPLTTSASRSILTLLNPVLALRVVSPRDAWIISDQCLKIWREKFSEVAIQSIFGKFGEIR